MKVNATFVLSAARAADLPRDGFPEVALIGRSNVGKSSLINALVRRTIARTSSTPGKTRLANVYRVEPAAGSPLYLMDLPGYGFAKGRTSEEEFAAVTSEYFGRGQAVNALLLVDARHPGLANDLEAWTWLKTAAVDCGLVVTKIDKLARGERIRAVKAIESVHEHSVLPVSAVTGEGLDELWKLMDRLANNRSPRSSSPRRATGPRHQKK